MKSRAQTKNNKKNFLVLVPKLRTTHLAYDLKKKPGKYSLSRTRRPKELYIFQLEVVTRGGELGILRVREHPLSTQVHPLIAKSNPSKM